MMLFMQKADHGVQAGIDVLRMITGNQQRLHKDRKPSNLNQVCWWSADDGYYRG